MSESSNKQPEPYTQQDFASRMLADLMSPEHRMREMRRLGQGNIQIPFADWHQRVEELVGRPVWTHEIGLAWSELVEEARTREHPSLEEVIARAERTGKPVIVVETGDDRGQ